MLEGSCHCGRVRLAVVTAPSEVTECNCSICRRLGARWAYYSPAEVVMPKAGTTHPYVWGDRMLAFHRCRSCGVTTHWQSLDASKARMAINARIFEGLDWEQVRTRHFDGAATWEYMD